MRRILVDHARSLRYQKRGRESLRIRLDEAIPATDSAASFRTSGYNSSINLLAAASSSLRKSVISRAKMSGSGRVSYMLVRAHFANREKKSAERCIMRPPALVFSYEGPFCRRPRMEQREPDTRAGQKES